MHRMTRNNIGQRLGVLFIEYKVRTNITLIAMEKRLQFLSAMLKKRLSTWQPFKVRLVLVFRLLG